MRYCICLDWSLILKLRMSVKELIAVGVEESGVDVERTVVDEEMR